MIYYFLEIEGDLRHYVEKKGDKIMKETMKSGLVGGVVGAITGLVAVGATINYNTKKKNKETAKVDVDAADFSEEDTLEDDFDVDVMSDAEEQQ